MDAMKIIQMALDAAAQTSEEPLDGVSRNADGTITITRTFRLDPAAVADLGSAGSGRAAPSGASANPSAAATAQDTAAATCCDSKGHDTPLENCKAKNPMFCPYHGIAAMGQSFVAIMKAQGLQNCGFDIVKKPSGAFAISVNCSPGAQPYVEKALDAFLGQPGFIPVGEKMNKPNKKASTMMAVFKQDTLEKPTDAEMLGEWTDTLFEDEDLVGTEEFGDLLSMQAELEELAGKGNPTDEESAHMAELAQQAKDLYHKLKGKSDYNDIQDIADAILKGDELADAFEKTYGDAKALQSQLQQAKHDTWGTKMNPVGFPGSDEVSSSGGAILKYDGDAMTEAKNALAEALANEDLDAAKLALHQMESVAEAAEKHLGKYKANVDAMVASLKACAEKGIGMKDAKGKGKQEKMAWFEAMGIAHPEELKKAAADVEAKAGVTKELGTQKAEAVAEAVTGKAEEKEAAESIVPVTDMPEDMLKPLEHDESKFPAEITQAALDAAIASGKSLGGASGDHAMLVTIDGKKYAAKSGTGSHAKHIHNEVIADQAYRAGGILVPDCKEYVFGGKTYKLAEFIEGKRLDQFMSSASEPQKEALRKDLLKGYPLDVLFSNWDVIGTSRDNVIVDKDGHAWRIDNGGSFNMAAQSNTKDLSYAKANYDGKCVFEDWDKTGGWSSRQWIDDFRTMRVDSKNKGLFDRYSTASIFLAAGNINMKAVVASLPQHLQASMKKPLHEMNQMTHRALNLGTLGGYRNEDLLSVALDSSYEASKLGVRDSCSSAVHYNKGGFGDNQTSAYAKKPFPKPQPEPPEDPMAAINDPDKHLPNSQYTGSAISQILITAAKSINYHAGKSMHEGGNKMDEPDFTPNASSMAAVAKIDKEKLGELAKTDAGAKTLLNILDAIQESKANGYHTAIGMVPSVSIAASLPDGFKTKAEKAFEKDKKGAIAKYEAAKKEFDQELSAWEKEKLDWDTAEEAKAIASGKSQWTNFHEFANSVMTKNFDTNGLQHGGGPTIHELESQAQHQKGSSGSACRLKLWEMALMGMSLQDIAKLDDKHPLIHKKTHASGIDAAVQYYMAHPKKWASDLRAYAVYKGLNLLKMENEQNSLYHHDSGTICVFRGLHGTVLDTKGAEQHIVKGENEVHQEGAADCCMFEKNDWTSEGQQAYLVPMSRVCFNFHNNGINGSHVGSYASEQEIITNLIGMIPYGVDSGSYAKAHKQALTGKKIGELLEKWKKRLLPFK